MRFWWPVNMRRCELGGGGCPCFVFTVNRPFAAAAPPLSPLPRGTNQIRAAARFGRAGPQWRADRPARRSLAWSGDGDAVQVALTQGLGRRRGLCVTQASIAPNLEGQGTSSSHKAKISPKKGPRFPYRLNASFSSAH